MQTGLTAPLLVLVLLFGERFSLSTGRPGQLSRIRTTGTPDYTYL